jgi:hypothetical protein
VTYRCSRKGALVARVGHRRSHAWKGAKPGDTTCGSAAVKTRPMVSGFACVLRDGFIVRSGDFEKVYMVAADIQGPGLERAGDVGVWAINSPNAEGLVYAGR